MKGILKENLAGKTVFLRVDLNSDVRGGNLVVSARLRQHSLTIKQLSAKGCKLVVFAHQGRQGDDDFISLEQHARAIENEIGKKVALVKWESDYVEVIRNLKDGEIVLMENTRFLAEESEEKSPEEHAAGGFVAKLLPVGDYFVEDALSVCHRSHASVVGFSSLPCFMGPVLEKEIAALQKLKTVKGGRLLVLGGAKPDDSIKLLKHSLEKQKVDTALAGGLFGELFLKASGIDFGAKEKFFDEKGYSALLADFKKALDSFGRQILLPVDLAVDANGRKELAVSELPSDFIPCDIGKKTIALFKKEISKAKLVVFNGPMGIYEKGQFVLGTREILEAISKSKAFSILGGGDTETALQQLSLPAGKFSHVSLAGKALLSYLSGKELPGLKVLGVE